MGADAAETEAAGRPAVLLIHTARHDLRLHGRAGGTRNGVVSSKNHGGKEAAGGLEQTGWRGERKLGEFRYGVDKVVVDINIYGDDPTVDYYLVLLPPNAIALVSISLNHPVPAL